MNKFISYLIVFVLGLAIMLYFNKDAEPIIIEHTVEIPVEVPVIVKEFDTVIKHIPIKVPGETVVDSTLLKKYNELKDQAAKDSLFRDSIKLREYNTTFEDDTLTIDVYTKVRGSLLTSQASYETKPRTIVVDTTLKIPIKKKAKLYGGGLINLGAEGKAGIAPTLMLINKKENLAIPVGYDFINKEIKAGILFKF